MTQSKNWIACDGWVLPLVASAELPGPSLPPENARFRHWRFVICWDPDAASVDNRTPFRLADRPALFRRFMEIDDEPAAVSFVRENGTLTSWAWEERLKLSVLADRPPLFQQFAEVVPRDAFTGFADPVDVILSHARSMRATWNLWCPVRDLDVDSVERSFRWVRIHGVNHAVPLDDGLWQTAAGDDPEPYRFVLDVDDEAEGYSDDDTVGRNRNGRLHRWTPSLPETKGLASVNGSVPAEAKLADARQWITANLTGALKRNVKISLVWADEAPAVRFEASCLLAGLWLQMHAAMAGGAVIRVCPMCKRPFELSTSSAGRRADALYCSDTCKTRNARSKRVRMHELAKNGMGVAQIAETVGAGVATVARQIESGPRAAKKPSRTAMSSKGAKQ